MFKQRCGDGIEEWWGPEVQESNRVGVSSQQRARFLSGLRNNKYLGEGERGMCPRRRATEEKRDAEDKVGSERVGEEGRGGLRQKRLVAGGGRGNLATGGVGRVGERR